MGYFTPASMQWRYIWYKSPVLSVKFVDCGFIINQMISVFFLLFLWKIEASKQTDPSTSASSPKHFHFPRLLPFVKCNTNRHVKLPPLQGNVVRTHFSTPPSLIPPSKRHDRVVVVTRRALSCVCLFAFSSVDRAGITRLMGPTNSGANLF